VNRCGGLLCEANRADGDTHNNAEFSGDQAMPTYEYRCEKCGHEFEEFQAITAKPIKKCPQCGKLTVKRLISAGVGIIFRGSGFYETDYRSEQYKAAAKKDSESGKPESAAATDAKSDGKTGAKSESKPDARPAEKAAAKPTVAAPERKSTPQAAPASTAKASKSAKK
jgi:putative FmdB family regulatory protein